MKRLISPLALGWAAFTFAFLAASVSAAEVGEGDEGFVPLFPKDGVPEGWRVTAWSDVSVPAPEGVDWRVKDGVLHGSEPRGTWLVSEKEYGDFILEYEWRLGERGNSGLGLRFPMKGDPAFDGLELQMVDPRYYGDAAPRIPQSELAGSFYMGHTASKQMYKPTEWNKYRVTMIGPRAIVEFNGETVIDIDLDQFTYDVERGSPLKDRPRRGRIGFQELSRGGGNVMIRNARIKILDGGEGEAEAVESNAKKKE